MLTAIHDATERIPLILPTAGTVGKRKEEAVMDRGEMEGRIDTKGDTAQGDNQVQGEHRRESKWEGECSGTVKSREETE